MSEENRENKKGKEKKDSKEVQISREQTKFFVDLSREPDVLRSVFDLLAKANDKFYGDEVLFKDLAIYAIGKLSDKDIVKIQEVSMSEMEKVERLLNDYNQKNELELSLGEFLVRKLGI